MLIALGSFRLKATGASVSVEGIVLTDAGTADLAAELEPATGVQVYLDGGDGVISTHTDVLLSSSDGAATMVHNFADPINLMPNEEVDVWVVVAIKGYPELVGSRIFAVSIAGPSAVSAPGATVALGIPEPRTNDVMVLPKKGGPMVSCTAMPGLCIGPLPWLFPLAALVLARLRRRRLIKCRREVSHGQLPSESVA